MRANELPGLVEFLTDKKQPDLFADMPQIRPEGAPAKEDGVRTAASTTAAPPTCAPASSRASSSQPKMTAAEDLFEQWEREAKQYEAKSVPAPRTSVEVAPTRDCPFYGAASSAPDRGALFTGY